MLKKPDMAPGIWRYRDYVIRSTNDDKRWDMIFEIAPYY